MHRHKKELNNVYLHKGVVVLSLSHFPHLIMPNKGKVANIELDRMFSFSPKCLGKWVYSFDMAWMIINRNVYLLFSQKVYHSFGHFYFLTQLRLKRWTKWLIIDYSWISFSKVETLNVIWQVNATCYYDVPIKGCSMFWWAVVMIFY